MIQRSEKVHLDPSGGEIDHAQGPKDFSLETDPDTGVHLAARPNLEPRVAV